MTFLLTRFLAVFMASMPWVVCVPAAAEDVLLDPQTAFRFSANLVAPDTVQVRYQIAEGYYLYRDRLQFSADENAVELGAPRLPAGKFIQDEFFGNVETYRGKVLIELPLRSSIPPGGFTLKALSQGCADVGVCYTPQTQKAMLRSVAADAGNGVPAARRSPGLLDRWQRRNESSQADEEFLPVDKAFRIEARAADARTLIAILSPAESYYLYRDKMQFSIPAGSGVTIDKVELPRGKTKQDPNFGATEVFHDPVQAVIRLRRDAPQPSALVLDIGFQGCSEKGLCYPPATRQIPITLASFTAEGAQPPSAAVPDTGRASGSSQQASEDQQIATMLGTGNFWLVMASFLGFGLLLSFTPCVLPMVPILSGLIAGQGNKVTRLRGFSLSLIYVLGMAITYAIAGVLAGMSGTLLATTLQTPWVLGLFAAIFVLLALSMFGFYELQLPASWQTRAASSSNRLTGGTLAGVFAMGALSAVIVGPCVAAPLAGALLYVSQTSNIWLGGSALFMLALGMGLPLLVIGASAGTLLPKVGAWMQVVKNFFGVLLLAAAIWMVSPLLPVAIQMLSWAVLLVTSAVYLHAIDPLPPAAGGLRKLWKAIGVIALLLGIALLIGGLSGGRDLLQPLAGLQVRTGGQATSETPFMRVASVAELDRAIAQADKPVMLDFYADWCVACKEMERLTFRDETVRARLDNLLLLQADVTANTAADAALLRRFGLYGPPGIVFFDPQGREIREARVIGYRSAARFLPVLTRVLDSGVRP